LEAHPIDSIKVDHSPQKYKFDITSLTSLMQSITICKLKEDVTIEDNMGLESKDNQRRLN
jgi:hypothetical protein